VADQLTATSSTGASVAKPAAKPAGKKVVSQWSDTVIDVSGLSNSDAGLTAAPLR
jgi:hypothetical protein